MPVRITLLGLNSLIIGPDKVILLTNQNPNPLYRFRLQNGFLLAKLFRT